jgi:glycosyltransferase involved in cell wall biosynthesis
MNLGSSLTQQVSSKSIQISVIIPARNAAKTLRKQLDSIANQSTNCNFEVVVVDDKSTDSTVQVATSHFSHQTAQIQCISSNKRLGVCGARNLGAKHAQGQLLIFCDADDWAEANLLDAYHRAFVEAPNAIFAGRVIERAIDLEGEAIGAFLDRPGSFRGIDYPHGCNMAIGTKVFDALHGFDERIKPNYFEEVDLAIRAHFSGVQVKFVPHAVMHYSIEKKFWPSIQTSVRNGRNAALVITRLTREFGPLTRLISPESQIPPFKSMSRATRIFRRIKRFPFYLGYLFGLIQTNFMMSKKAGKNELTSERLPLVK